MQEGCLHFAAALGEALQWTRPIYCGAKLLTPPTDVPAKALWWNLYRLQSEPVDLLVAAPQDEPVTEFRDGIALLGVHLTPAGALPGEPVRVTLDWRCRQEIRHSAFVQISLAPVESPHSLLPQGQMLLNYGTWLAHGVRPLPPTASGFAYRQEVLILVPTNAQPGEWRLRLGVSSEKGDPIELHEVVGLQVVQRDAQRSNSAGPGAPDSRGRMPP
jgi:hypothetical protein